MLRPMGESTVSGPFAGVKGTVVVVVEVLVVDVLVVVGAKVVGAVWGPVEPHAPQTMARSTAAERAGQVRSHFLRLPP
jgi:hypothetical protein